MISLRMKSENLIVGYFTLLNLKDCILRYFEGLLTEYEIGEP